MNSVRERIIRETVKLLVQGGRQAVSSRNVSAAAGVQPPIIYRHFGDMRGLLNAVVRETFAEYVRQKSGRELTDDPVEDLRRGWDVNVAFGLANPAVYALMYEDPAIVAGTPAAATGYAQLYELINRVAQAGRLRVSIPHATLLFSTASQGVILSLISTPPEARDAKLAAGMREAVIAAITIPQSSDTAASSEPDYSRVAARAVALRSVLADAPPVLTQAESQLLKEWLDRLADASQ